jgi:hypothetical protein
MSIEVFLGCLEVLIPSWLTKGRNADIVSAKGLREMKWPQEAR